MLRQIRPPTEEMCSRRARPAERISSLLHHRKRPLFARGLNRSRGRGGERPGEHPWAEEEREGLGLSQDHGVQPHARQELSR